MTSVDGAKRLAAEEVVAEARLTAEAEEAERLADEEAEAERVAYEDRQDAGKLAMTVRRKMLATAVF